MRLTFLLAGASTVPAPAFGTRPSSLDDGEVAVLADWKEKMGCYRN